MTRVRTRFAPSPTGYLHVGGARTALFNYLYARANGGDFILRIEDTDQVRSTEQSYEQLIESLRWLGLEWDEGPETGGPHAPYRQSERLPLYQEIAGKLVEEGKAYPCFCTAHELEVKKSQREAMGLPPVYDGKCRNLSREEANNRIAAGEEHTIRFRMPREEVLVDDIVQGPVRFDSALIGDFIMVKSDGFPSYNFAVVCDDHKMEISHVIRGVGHLSNTPRQIVIYRALNWPEPRWAHVSEIVGSDHKKLSKRHGATSITAFRDLGYPADAFNNFMALLGWSSPDGQEYLSFADLKSRFDVERCSKSPSMFDIFDVHKVGEAELNKLTPAELIPYLLEKSKLNWISNQTIRARDESVYLTEVMPFVQASGVLPAGSATPDDATLRSVLLSLRVYLDYYAQIGSYLPDFYLDFDPSAATEAAREWLGRDFAARLAGELKDQFMRLSEWNEPAIKSAISNAGQTLGIKGKDLFMTTRCITTGKTAGLELPVYLSLLGREKVTLRAAAMAAFLSGARTVS